MISFIRLAGTSRKFFYQRNSDMQRCTMTRQYCSNFLKNLSFLLTVDFQLGSRIVIYSVIALSKTKEGMKKIRRKRKIFVKRGSQIRNFLDGIIYRNPPFFTNYM